MPMRLPTSEQKSSCPIGKWLLAISIIILPFCSLHTTPQGVARDAVAGDSVRIDLPFEINFDLNFGVKPEMSDSLSLFLGVRHLPQSYMDDGEAPILTLKPYNCFTRYDEDPIHWQTMAGMMKLPRAVKQNVYVPFSIGPFSTATSGGAGFAICFSMEDILQSIFSKTYRAKKHNAKHANAWKTY